jgi:2-keto-4-pentenoate hydratase/2-oxohepta-3-ene-1,7-dioic acid hydratase in catechol pathway
MPRPGKVVAIGLNYQSHAIEQNIETPPAPHLRQVPDQRHRASAAIAWDRR